MFLQNGQQLHDNFLERKGHVHQFFGEEDLASRSKQTALIQEKISEMLSRQTDSVPSFCSAAETSALPPMQTFRADSPDGSRRRASCLDENGKPPARLFRSPVHVPASAAAAAASHQAAAAAAGVGVDQTRSPPGRLAPPPKKKPIAVSMSVNQLGPPPRAVSNDGVVDSWNHPGFPLLPNDGDDNDSREMLSGSVDQLQSVGSSFGRQKTPVTVPGGGGDGRGNGGARWVTSQKHAVIRRTPSVGHREVENATAVNRPRLHGPPTSPKPQPLPKPSFTPPGASSLRSSLPPVRRKFPSSTSFSDADDAKISPKPKPPLPPKRMDLMKLSVSADSSPCHRALPPAGELPSRQPPPPGITRPSSRPTSSAQSLSPPSPRGETSWQNSGFLVDLERVILQKRANGPPGGFEEEADVTKASPRGGDPDDLGDLPPPPVGLLAGLKGSNRPPLPPKRSNETKLTCK